MHLPGLLVGSSHPHRLHRGYLGPVPALEMVVVKIYSHSWYRARDLARMTVEVLLALLLLGSSLEAQVQHLTKARTHRSQLVACPRLLIVSRLLLVPILIFDSLLQPLAPYLLMLATDFLQRLLADDRDA